MTIWKMTSKSKILWDNGEKYKLPGEWKLFKRTVENTMRKKAEAHFFFKPDLSL